MRVALILLVAFAPVGAQALELSARAEGNLTVALGQPTATFLNPGPSAQLTALLGVLPFLAIELQGGYLSLPTTGVGGLTEGASGLWVGPGLRLQLPAGTSLFRPWVDLGLHYHRTGAYDRFSLAPGVGLNIRFTPTLPFWIGPQIRYMRVFSFGQIGQTLTADANFLFLGVGVEFDLVRAPVDDDKDGVPNSADACPTVAATTVDGCPVKDGDGDGVADDVDRCPAVAGVAANGGCAAVVAPVPSAPVDTDKDGVVDSADKCPTQPEDKDGFEDADGCPELDNDGDSIADAQDLCPNAAGAAALKGCPDLDKDGVADRDDQCPETPGTAELKGCPKRAEKNVHVADKELELLQNVLFVTGKSEISAKSFTLLDEVVSVLKERSVVCVAISGHTDNVGNPAQNLELSKARAEAVRSYLESRSIASRRLTAQGFGDTKPLAPNTTDAGRERNRRVVFEIVPCQNKEAQP